MFVEEGTRSPFFLEEVASEDYLFMLTEEESVWLMYATASQGIVLNCSFGPGWLALNWEKGQPRPEPVRLLGLRRGVLNQNVDGAGI
jgi:hypothetical protein